MPRYKVGDRVGNGSRLQRLSATGGPWPSSRHSAMTGSAPPWVIDGPINGELFTLYIERVLAPTLARGELVILDNLGSHKGKAPRNAIRATGAHLLFLPPYSPDLNPIEQGFAKLRHLMRAAQTRDLASARW
ncbi:transposase [Bradyrhizobium sp. RDM4]|uniref:transposase n=1 Tax=Bradyrhizobium sp. RDM4 TaxID=3378765 RepID=UPI0038FCB44A